MLTLERAADNAAVAADLRADGHVVIQYAAIPKLLAVDTEGVVWPDDRFQIVEEEGAARLVLQTITLGERTAGGSWGLIRHTRRSNPFKIPGLRFPITEEVDIARTGQGVDVYLIDSGIMGAHPEFSGQTHTVIYDGVGTGDVDEYGHGTAMASAIRGVTLGSARNCQMFVGRCFDASGTSPASSLADAMNAAILHYQGRGNRPGVMSMSFISNTQAVSTAAQAAADVGLVPVAAVGNARASIPDMGLGAPYWPFISNGVLSVGGIAPNDAPYNVATGGTNYGPEVDILAASELCYSAWNDGDYRVVNGTSFGCAVAAGMVACMLQGYARPTTRAQVYKLIDYVYRQATFGLQRDPRFKDLTDGILYLDPRNAAIVPPIPGLTKL